MDFTKLSGIAFQVAQLAFKGIQAATHTSEELARVNQQGQPASQADLQKTHDLVLELKSLVDDTLRTIRGRQLKENDPNHSGDAA